MAESLILGSLVWILAVGGKVFLQTMASLPVIGGLAAWYLNWVGPLPEGVTSNLVYGAMAAQLVILPLGTLMYAPGWIRAFRVLQLQRRKA